MPGLIRFRLLPAIALFLSFPFAPQAQLATTPAHLFAGASTRTDAPPSPRPTVSAQSRIPVITSEQKADILLAREEYQAAIQAYAGVQPPSTAVWNKMGIAYQMLFDLKDAARCYKESLKLDHNDIRALNDLATVDDSLSDFATAEHLYKQALKVEPRSAQILKNLGTNLLMQHQYGRGSDAYAQALAINPHIFETSSWPATDAPSPQNERGTVSYFEARSCARAGLSICAIQRLRSAFDEGSATVRGVANENDFESLRGTPEFESLLAEQK